MFLRNSPQKKGCAAKKGFTLLETLVAISIIGIALVAATAALQNSLQTSNFVKDQISAYYLAEDAMEYVVALRDAGAATQGWTSSLLPCITTIDVTAANASLFARRTRLIIQSKITTITLKPPLARVYLGFLVRRSQTYSLLLYTRASMRHRERLFLNSLHLPFLVIARLRNSREKSPSRPSNSRQSVPAMQMLIAK